MVVDWDDTLAYSTPKIIRIRHKLVGGVHKFAMVLVFVYIIVYQIVIKAGYTKKEAPVGTIELSLERGTSSQSMPSYCSIHNGLKCVAWGESDMAIIAQEPAAGICVATRANMTLQHAPATFLDYWTTMETDVRSEKSWDVYVAHASNYAIRVNHNFSSLSAKDHFGSASQDTASLVSTDGKLSVATSKSRDGDVFSIKDLLKGVLEVDLDSKGDEGETLRYSGINVLVYIRSSCESGGGVKYEYVASLASQNNHFYRTVPINSTARLQQELHGIDISFIMAGEVCTPDFQSLLLTLVSGLALTSLAATLADFALIYVLPMRKKYALFKYSSTPDFDPDTPEEQAVLDNILRKKQRKQLKVTGDLQQPLTEGSMG